MHFGRLIIVALFITPTFLYHLFTLKAPFRLSFNYLNYLVNISDTVVVSYFCKLVEYAVGFHTTSHTRVQPGLFQSERQGKSYSLASVSLLKLVKDRLIV